jgi:hypothetical protein
MAKKKGCIWDHAPDRRRKPTVLDALKREVQKKANDLA